MQHETAFHCQHINNATEPIADRRRKITYLFITYVPARNTLQAVL